MTSSEQAAGDEQQGPRRGLASVEPPPAFCTYAPRDWRSYDLDARPAAYWPGGGKTGQKAILAIITFAGNVLRESIVFYARKCRTCISFRVEDDNYEYYSCMGDCFTKPPARPRRRNRPLSLREMIAMIDLSIRDMEYGPGAPGGYLFGNLNENLECCGGGQIMEHADSIVIYSEVYPQLRSWYEGAMAQWILDRPRRIHVVRDVRTEMDAWFGGEEFEEEPEPQPREDPSSDNIHCGPYPWFLVSYVMKVGEMTDLEAVDALDEHFG